MRELIALHIADAGLTVPPQVLLRAHKVVVFEPADDPCIGNQPRVTRCSDPDAPDDAYVLIVVTKNKRDPRRRDTRMFDLAEASMETYATAVEIVNEL